MLIGPKRVSALHDANLESHLLCELLMQLQAVGLANGNSYELPITQNDLAETVGLTLVHVKRARWGFVDDS